MRNRKISAFLQIKREESPVEIHNHPIDIIPSDKARLEHFFRQETGYYNHLINGFSSLVRSFPEMLIECDEDWRKIFGYAAETKDNMRKYLNLKEDTQLPFRLEPYRNSLKSLTERKLILMNLATGPGVLLPIVRNNIAIEMLKFYQEQASKLLTPAASRFKDESDLYKEPPILLETVDNAHKRHVQIPKSALSLNWNAECNATEIRTGYTASPICIPDLNLLVRTNWNYIIVRQVDETHITPMSPWVADIKKIPAAYILRYFDRRQKSR